MIDDYLTHTATWRIPGGYNQYNEPEDPVDTEIRGRWEGHRNLVRDAQGNQVVSEGKFYTTALIDTGHSLLFPDGSEWPVINVSEMSGLDGKASHRELAL
jgi:hypothetical protein